MNKLLLILLILTFTCCLSASTIYKLRLFSSGCLNGYVSNYSIEGDVSADFPFAVAVGLEHETIKPDKSPKGWGMRMVVPPKVENVEATYEDSKENFGMLFNFSLYKFYKGMIPITKQSAVYLKFKFGTGLSYIAHLGIGGGFEIYDRFTLEAEYNYHLTTIFIAGLYTEYLCLNLGYSFQ